ncbi:MAG TPA: sigma-70 family RNA polymerase sigma factor [Syntrophomonadaceae bacterium]|nr:sigma-70 family RNA polymerase sigma factor [Syntrophomonadaceae bacterium]
MQSITQEQAEAIFREYSSYVYRVALFISRSSTMAEDITQETFLQVFRKYGSYDATRPIGPWLYKITLNITRNTLRKQKWLQLFMEIPEQKSTHSIEEEVLKNQIDQELWQEINHLTLKSREVIVLHYYLGLKLIEIAKVLDIPLGTCKSRLHTAMNSLTKKLRANDHFISYQGGDQHEKL